MNADQIERSLWQTLAARGAVRGEYAGTLRTPWPIRLLMGAAGWLGALFFQLFLVGSVFAAARGNGPAMAVTGMVMIGIAVVLYRVAGQGSGRIALGQFALAASLGGQGMLVFGAAEALGGERLVNTAPFWVGVAVLEAVLYLIVPNRLHRFLAALGLWLAVAFALNIALAGAVRYAWAVLPWSLGWLTPVACGAVTVFVLTEAVLAARGRLARWEPAADATLVFALGAALLVTGATHPLAMVFNENGAPRLPGAWLAGALIGAVLLGFALNECRRLQCAPPVSAGVTVVTIAFGALMVMAPAVASGVLALGLALRRGSLPWLGLAIATVALGFIWYYSTLQWTLLAKSATLVASGVLLLVARSVLMRLPRTEVVA
ncbi:DUF4401 domain-containing protein [Cupriavidus sp. RAF12]|uniref:DUF4401 domain-containing protein n=1 Tax=Cupriavidus sp. RAF12 TaxID=3233050 RepID=UPI003F9010CC